MAVFKRVEIKYLMSEEQYEALMKGMESHMMVDEYGLSMIQSIYYDTDNYDVIRESLEKPVYKEKLRLRAYGSEVDEDTRVYLELKKKYEGVVYKRRTSLKYRDAMDYLEKGVHPKKDNQILREIDYFLSFYKPTHRTYISCERIALFGIEDKELRITFDKNIRSVFDKCDFSKTDEGEYLLNPGERLMEIKAKGAMPLWLTGLLSELEIYPTSFSKYGTACMKFLE